MGVSKIQEITCRCEPRALNGEWATLAPDLLGKSCVWCSACASVVGLRPPRNDIFLVFEVEHSRFKLHVNLQ